MGTGSGGRDAMEMVSTAQVERVPGIFFSMFAIFACSAGVAWRKMRALRSPAISDRASVPRVRRKLSLKPRTPTRAATPMATESTTKPNLPGADFRSRQAIAAARLQLRARLLLRGSAMVRLGLTLVGSGFRPVRQRVFGAGNVPQGGLAVGGCRHF